MSSSNITLPVSLGEALDKYSILELKKQRIKEPSRLSNVLLEMAALQRFVSPIISRYPYHYKCLLNINSDIWDLTDVVKSDQSQATLFSEIFLKNDARFRIKSKLNDLASSSLREQKSYETSSITLAPASSLDVYKARNGYIRYLSLCYDLVILNCSEELEEDVCALFHDDPSIKIQLGSDGASIDDIQEPIPNLLHKHDLSNVADAPVLNYICGGRLGDLIHALYVVRCIYHQTGKKGNVYITDDISWGGDRFLFPAAQTHAELVGIVSKQPYVASFSVHSGEAIDHNLNDFRKHPGLYHDSWLEIMSSVFKTPLLEQPWISLPSVDPKYKDTVVIHRSLHRHVPSFLPILEKIIKKNKCVFVTCNIQEYESFPFKDLVPVELKSNMAEIFNVIYSCKFFVGNQSSPLAIAYSMFKPLLCEHSEGKFYTNRKHYPGSHWYSTSGKEMSTISQYINYKVDYPFYGQFDTDRYIAEYFPDQEIGTCIDIGMADPIGGNNSYHFEQMGWTCLCIEPNPNYYKMGLQHRKNVENLACGDKDADDVIFEIFTINGDNQGAISSLKRDERLVESHSHMINKIEKIPTKVRTLNSVLAQHPEITHIDFVSVDTENTELDVLKGFDVLKWKPKLLVVENNYDEPFVADYLKQFGYIRDRRIAINDFFIFKDEPKYEVFHGELQEGKRVDETLREYFPEYSYKGVFVDIGAYEPINISNSYHFERNGWDVHCFEANTHRIPQLKSLRKNVYNYAIYDTNEESVTFNVVHGSWGDGSLTAGVSAVELDPRYMKEFGHGIKAIEKIEVPQKTLNTVIEEEIKIDHIDILSIDVEGGELKVLKGLDLQKYKPKVILVEDVFNDIELHEHLLKENYRLDKTVLYNKYYVPNL